jgi:hypothetical protein
MKNFESAALWSNRKLDKYANDTIYGNPVFNKGITIKDGASVTGNTTFTSSVTFSNQVLISTGIHIKGALGAGLANGLMVLVSSHQFQGITIATINLPTDKYQYFTIVGAVKNVTGGNAELSMRFNGDKADNYGFAEHNANITGSGGTGCGYPNRYVRLTTLNYVPNNGWTNINMELTLADATNIFLMSKCGVAGATVNLGQTFVYYDTTPTTMNIFYSLTSGDCAVATTAIASGITGSIYIFALPL